MSSTLIEPLESRQFLSASPFFLSHQSKFTTYTDAKAEAYAEAVAKATAISKAHHIIPSILGQWSGKAKTTIVVVSKSAEFDLDITSVKAKYAEGTITVAGHTYSGRVVGSTKSDNEFSYSYTKGKASVRVDGLLNGLNTEATGTITAKYAGWTLHGTFHVYKIADTTPSTT